MRRYEERSFPHPVLSYFNDDFPKGKFEAGINVRTGWDFYNISSVFSLTCPDLEKLISRGEAGFGIQILCPQSYFRRIKLFSSDSGGVSINSDRLDGIVRIIPLILAIEDVSDFSGYGLHDDYKGVHFEIPKGSILALGEPQKFDAAKHIDPLRKTPSIFTLRNSQKSEPSIDYDLSSEKIVIHLSKEVFENYIFLKEGPSFQPILASMIVLPVLAEVLNILKNSENEEFEDRRWFRVLRMKLEDAGIPLEGNEFKNESGIKTAANLIGSTFLDSFQRLAQFNP